MFTFLKNIQTNQTIVLSFILILWVVFFGLNISFFEIFFTFFTVIWIDALLTKYYSGEWRFPYSWVNAWFGISFFLRSDDAIIYLFAWALAIFGKHIIQSAGKHFLNPSNMSVFMTLMLFPGITWVNTLQWWNYTGSVNIYYAVLFLTVLLLWLIMCLRVYQSFWFTYVYDYILPFVGGHIVLFFLIPAWENLTTAVSFF